MEHSLQLHCSIIYCGYMLRQPSGSIFYSMYRSCSSIMSCSYIMILRHSLKSSAAPSTREGHPCVDHDRHQRFMVSAAPLEEDQAHPGVPWIAIGWSRYADTIQRSTFRRRGTGQNTANGGTRGRAASHLRAAGYCGT